MVVCLLYRIKRRLGGEEVDGVGVMKDEELKLEEIEVSLTFMSLQSSGATMFERDRVPRFDPQILKFWRRNRTLPQDAQRKQKQSKYDGGLGKKKKLRQSIFFSRRDARFCLHPSFIFHAFAVAVIAFSTIEANCWPHALLE